MRASLRDDRVSLSGQPRTAVPALPRDATAAEAPATFSREAVVMRMDTTNDDDLVTLEELVRHREGDVDGVLHATAFAPKTAVCGAMVDRATGVELVVPTGLWSDARSMPGPLAGLLAGAVFDGERGSTGGRQHHGPAGVDSWMGPSTATRGSRRPTWRVASERQAFV